MENDSPVRILLLQQFLRTLTDEDHSASVSKILQFRETHGIRASRKSVYSDIQLLTDQGMDIVCVKSTQNRYFLGSRLFELPELKLLVDAAESSHFIATLDKGKQHKQQQNSLPTLPKTPLNCKMGGVFVR